MNNKKNTCVPLFQIPLLFTLCPVCFIIYSPLSSTLPSPSFLPSYLATLFSDPFESKLHLLWPLAYKYFRVYFLKIRIISFVTTIQLSTTINLTTGNYGPYSSFVNWPNNSPFWHFSPTIQGLSRSHVSFTPFNPEYSHSLFLLWHCYFWSTALLSFFFLLK